MPMLTLLDVKVHVKADADADDTGMPLPLLSTLVCSPRCRPALDDWCCFCWATGCRAPRRGTNATQISALSVLICDTGCSGGFWRYRGVQVNVRPLWQSECVMMLTPRSNIYSEAKPPEQSL